MPTFDVVSEIDLQEVRNAVDQAAREAATRFDFKGTNSRVELNGHEITLHSVSEDRLKALRQVQGDQLRVSGRKRDDLQSAIQAMRQEDFGIPLQFTNFRD